MTEAARYPGIRVTANGNQLVSYHTETRIADASEPRAGEPSALAIILTIGARHSPAGVAENSKQGWKYER